MRGRLGLTLALCALAVPGAGLASAAPERGTADLKCFGAAARDPLDPCRPTRKRWRVVPTPDDALLTPNSACTRQKIGDTLRQCAFGVPAPEATETVVVLGDSHAAHWRPAIAVVAQAKRWRVLELATPHCPLSLAEQGTRRNVTEWCPEWNRQVIEWLYDHPEVRTVIFSAHVRAPIVVPPGKKRWPTQVAGYVGAWQRLPDSVKRILVIRDNPIGEATTGDCVRKAIATRRSPARACPVRRAEALPRDPAEAAAEQLWMRGARVIDLTQHFCGPNLCLPVVGGVLVHRDVDHLTQLFAKTLGPYLLRAIDTEL
jgi:hypothetical protein